MAEHKRVSMLEDPEGREVAACPVCFRVLEIPTSGCPEGHLCCRACYTTWLETNDTCPTCRWPTDVSRFTPIMNPGPEIAVAIPPSVP